MNPGFHCTGQMAVGSVNAHVQYQVVSMGTGASKSCGSVAMILPVVICLTVVNFIYKTGHILPYCSVHILIFIII